MSIRETDPVYCLELPQLKEATDDGGGAYVLLCWVNLLVVEDHCARFSSPYTMQVDRETSYEDLQKLILKEMNAVLHDDILVSSQDVRKMSYNLITALLLDSVIFGTAVPEISHLV
jgi:ubiquitin carboxyl-terminal hydrolase 31